MIEVDVDNTISVVHLLGNNVFMVDTPGGEKRLPAKGNNVNYHVEERLYVASRDTMKEMFCATLPVMKAGGDCRKVILSPLS